MPALNGPPALILVTGASGYVGTWIVQQLLNIGYSVRAAVRTADRGQHLQQIFQEHGGKLEIIAVGDIVDENAFNEAVRNVDGVIHTASPVATAVDHPNDVILPAVKGVTGLLQSALSYGSRIQRIVLTSSCAAILDTSDTVITVSEKDWNDQRVVECEKFGRNAAGLSKYSASKTLAERAAWDFWDSNKDRLKWDISVINPPYIFGPILHEVKSPQDLRSSTKYFYDAIIRNEFVGLPPTRRPGHGYVDVRDVAAAHIKALQTPGAGGERIIVSAGSWVWQDAVNTAVAIGEPLYKLHPATVSSDDIPTRFITFDTKKQAQILGLELRSMMDIVHDVLVDYSKRGWIS